MQHTKKYEIDKNSNLFFTLQFSGIRCQLMWLMLFEQSELVEFMRQSTEAGLTFAIN